MPWYSLNKGKLSKTRIKLISGNVYFNRLNLIFCKIILKNQLELYFSSDSFDVVK
jgi:hypothetical protein